MEIEFYYYYYYYYFCNFADWVVFYQNFPFYTYRKSVRNSNIFGVTFGTSTSLMMLAQAAAFALGGKLVQDGELVFDDMFK